MGNLRHLAGLPIPFYDNSVKEPILIGSLYPITLREIAEIGERTYNKHLNAITFDIEDIEKIKGDEGEEITLTPYEILLVNIFYTDVEVNFHKTIIDALTFFFKEKPTFDERGFFYFGNMSEGRLIHKENFDELRNLLKEQNCLLSKKEKEDIYNPANERAKKIAEKLNKARKKITELKKKKEEKSETSLTLFDLVSILASNGNNLNITNIWDLTMYQFNDQFNRMKMLDEYEVNVQALLHGADSKQVELKHYMRKIES